MFGKHHIVYDTIYGNLVVVEHSLQNKTAAIFSKSIELVRRDHHNKVCRLLTFSQGKMGWTGSLGPHLRF